LTADQYRRVLVVDDDAEIRRMVSVALRQRELIVDEASDGQQAIEHLTAQRYAVVVLDLMMPHTDGFAVLDALKHRQEQPVVLVISGAEGRLLDRLDSRLIHGVIKKPFDPIELAAVVRACSDVRGRSTFETMAVATMLSTAPLIALLRL
jgi:DNA-binding response OmpR family regulator